MENNWLDKNDIEFIEIDNNESIKNNFFYQGKNFILLSSWLKDLKTYLRYLYNLIDPTEITKNVLNSLYYTKTNISISTNIDYDTPFEYIDITTKSVFRIIKTNIDGNDIYEISNGSISLWNVDNIIVCVKIESSGEIITPIITTKSSKIILKFIGQNYDNIKIILL